MGAAHSSAGAVSDDDIAKIFKRLDPSETGSIGEEQVISLIEGVLGSGRRPTKRQVAQLIAAADLSKDGRLQLPELIGLVRKFESWSRDVRSERAASACLSYPPPHTDDESFFPLFLPSFCLSVFLSFLLSLRGDSDNALVVCLCLQLLCACVCLSNHLPACLPGRRGPRDRLQGSAPPRSPGAPPARIPPRPPPAGLHRGARAPRVPDEPRPRVSSGGHAGPHARLRPWRIFFLLAFVVALVALVVGGRGFRPTGKKPQARAAPQAPPRGSGATDAQAAHLSRCVANGRSQTPKPATHLEPVYRIPLLFSVPLPEALNRRRRRN
jgi:hypothetical protein